MNIKSEKGISTIDITVAIIIITLLLSVVITLIVNINTNSNKINMKSDATNYALDEIEKIKAEGWIKTNEATFNEELKEFEFGEEYENGKYKGYIKDSENMETPFYKTVKVKDASDISEEIEKDVLQKVTVVVSYRVGNQEENVSLSTVLENMGE